MASENRLPLFRITLQAVSISLTLGLGKRKSTRCGAGTRLTSGLASASGIGKLRGRECGSETASK